MNKINDVYDWKILSESYFLCATICCDSLLDELKNIEEKSLHCYNYEKNFKFKFSAGNLIKPVVFSFKHGVELYLKGLGKLWNVEPAHKHDLLFLKQYVIDQTQDINMVEVLEKLWTTLIKYYSGEYLGLVHPKSDKMNEAERYPEGNGYKIPFIISMPEYKEDNLNSCLVVSMSTVYQLKEDILLVADCFKNLYEKGFAK